MRFRLKIIIFAVGKCNKTMNKSKIKPLDFVKAKPYTDTEYRIQICPAFKQIRKEKKRIPREIGIVTEVCPDGRMSVEWIGGSKTLHNSWWEPDKLIKIDSLPNLISRNMAHPFGNNKKYVDEFYPKK